MEFSPITLLFGANSVGKSSIIKAIKNFQSLSLDDAFHGENSVAIGLYFDLDATDKKSLHTDDIKKLYPSIHKNEPFIETSFILSGVNKIGFEKTISNIELKPSKDFQANKVDTDSFKIHNKEVFENNTLYLNDEVFFETRTCTNQYYDDHEAIWLVEKTNINSDHSLFKDFIYINSLERISKTLRSLKSQARGHAMYTIGKILSDSPINLVSDIEDALNIIKLEKNTKSNPNLLILAAILSFIKNINLKLDGYISNFNHLGPLRSIPDTDFKIINSKLTNSKQDTLRKVDYDTAYNLLFNKGHIKLGLKKDKVTTNKNDGISEWLRLAYSKAHHPKNKNESEEVNQVNSWLTNWFNTPYEINFQSTYSFTVDSKEKNQALIEGRINMSYIDKVESFVKVCNIQNGSVTDLKDIGVGISQLLPVIVNAMVSPNFSVEQPELHIHPKMQSTVADLFVFEGLYAPESAKIKGKVISVNTKNLDGDEKTYKFIERQDEHKSFILVETHSEHLMLRLLKRVRQNILNPKDLAVYYFKNDQGKSSIVHLGVDVEGDFTSHWPDGFFEERIQELF